MPGKHKAGHDERCGRPSSRQPTRFNPVLQSSSSAITTGRTRTFSERRLRDADNALALDNGPLDHFGRRWNDMGLTFGSHRPR